MEQNQRKTMNYFMIDNISMENYINFLLCVLLTSIVILTVSFLAYLFFCISKW